MEQRRLRLGDILDDYCPRERRVTNHVIVAMVDDDVKQTRCSTCDADHEYKHARVPQVRRKKEAGALSTAAAVPEVPRTRQPDPPEPDEVFDESESAAPLEAAPEVPEGDALPTQSPDDDGPVHRRLIRATLPRPEGQVPERREPDFTVRQPQSGRGREVDGNRPPQNQNRHRRAHRPGGGRAGDVREGQAQGNARRGGGGQGNRGGQSPHGQYGGNPQGGQRNNGPGGGGRFRRRRGR